MPLLKSSQTNASALAAGSHLQVAAASAGDWPSNTRHRPCEQPFAWFERVLLAAHPVVLDLFVNVIITLKSEYREKLLGSENDVFP